MDQVLVGKMAAVGHSCPEQCLVCILLLQVAFAASVVVDEQGTLATVVGVSACRYWQLANAGLKTVGVYRSWGGSGTRLKKSHRRTLSTDLDMEPWDHLELSHQVHPTLW